VIGVCARQRCFLAPPEWALAELPELAVERFFPAALLSITAEHDTVVPPAAARVLHEKLEARYHTHPERLSYRAMAGASHFMQPQEWASAVDLASAWLAPFPGLMAGSLRIPLHPADWRAG
jgi:hypothetical protein